MSVLEREVAPATRYLTIPEFQARFRMPSSTFEGLLRRDPKALPPIVRLGSRIRFMSVSAVDAWERASTENAQKGGLRNGDL